MADHLAASTCIVFLIAILISYAAIQYLYRPSNAYDVLPWVGVLPGWFGRYRTRFSMASSKDVIHDAYERYNVNGLSFIVPSFLSHPRIVIPPSQAQWLIDQPDEIISFKAAVSDFLSLAHTTLSPRIVTNPIHHDVVKGNLTRSLGATSGLVLDELRQSFNTDWGVNETEWTNHVVWESMLKVFAQTSARVFIGLELCRNVDFLAHVVKYAEYLITSGAKIRMMPESLKPLLGPILTIPNRTEFSKIHAYLAPIIEKRKLHLLRSCKEPDYVWDEPFDLLQWLIRRAYNENEVEIETTQICKRFAVLCFAAIHTTSLTSTNLLLDIISADPKHDTITKLREEIIQVYQDSGCQWSKASLSKLVRMDSAIRESQRMHPPGTWSLNRKVIAKNGVKMLDGLIAPKGAIISVSAYNLHRDEGHYDNPDDYDPFRFYRVREALGSESSKGKKGPPKSDKESVERKTKVLKDRNLAAVSTSLSHLPFGYGRHACPGRFFAIQEVKLMMVHVLMNYDLKRLENRPENPWLHDMMIPSLKATISVKKVQPMKRDIL